MRQESVYLTRTTTETKQTNNNYRSQKKEMDEDIKHIKTKMEIEQTNNKFTSQKKEMAKEDRSIYSVKTEIVKQNQPQLKKEDPF